MPVGSFGSCVWPVGGGVGVCVGVVGVCVPPVSAVTRFVINDVQSTGVAGGVGVFGVIAVGDTGVMGVNGDVVGVDPACGCDHVIWARDGLDGFRTRFIRAGGWNIPLAAGAENNPED